jgi:uncharacterized protein Smg (DUF494 family)
MTDSGFATLQSAVTIAKDRQITSARKLIASLLVAGFKRADIDEAVDFLSAYEKDKQTGVATGA